MKQIDVQVLIVGAGPVGLTASLLLGRMGISHMLVERRPGPQRAPAAHVVNARTLEILRQAGADMEAITRAAKVPADAGHVYWVDHLGGEIIGHLPFERQSDDVLAVTPTPLRNISQHRLEPILVDSLVRAGFEPPRYSHQWKSARQTGDEVVSQIHAIAGDETYEVRSRYVLACDGAGSPVRRWLGIEPEGPERIQSFVMIHFRADLRSLVADSPGILYWICDPRAGGTLVAHDIDSEWVYMHAWDPDSESMDHYDVPACETLVRRALGGADVALSVATISNWTMTAQVVPHYRDGNVFLVGDAAHRFPPTGGLGLNTGVQDAHNLAWKIADVLAGHAGESLLDTYESERRPVALHNADQSLGNAMRLLEVPQALGMLGEPEAAAATMQAILADSDGRAGVAAAIANQAEHFDMLGLQLGYVYGEGALVRHEGDGDEPASSVRKFVASSRAGSRLPHGWVERNGETLSTLDLVALQGMTLLIGPQASAWAEAAREIRTSIHCIQLGSDVSDPSGWWRVTAAMSPTGVLLVRPDQHVAFRSQSGDGDPAALLQAVMNVVAPPIFPPCIVEDTTACA